MNRTIINMEIIQYTKIRLGTSITRNKEELYNYTAFGYGFCDWC